MKDNQTQNSTDKLIEVQVTPKNPDVISNGKWYRFKKFIKQVFTSSEAKEASSSVKEYLDLKFENEKEIQKRAKYVNKKLAAEIDDIVMNTQAVKNDNQRANLSFEDERDLVKANVRLKNAEASAIEAETTIKIYEELNKHGFNVDVSINDDVLSIRTVETKVIQKEQDLLLNQTQTTLEVLDDSAENKIIDQVAETTTIVNKDSDNNIDELEKPNEGLDEHNDKTDVYLDIPAFLRNQAD